MSESQDFRGYLDYPVCMTENETDCFLINSIPASDEVPVENKTEEIKHTEVERKESE